jgi:hypothetical protein
VSPVGLYQLCQGILDVLKTLSDLGDCVSAAILEFDICGNVPLLLFEKLEYWLDRRVALAPRHIRTIVLLAILEMKVGNPIVMLVDVCDRIEPRGEKMADVEVDVEVLDMAIACAKLSGFANSFASVRFEWP